MTSHWSMCEAQPLVPNTPEKLGHCLTVKQCSKTFPSKDKLISNIANLQTSCMAVEVRFFTCWS